jgi:hypothetical protein
MRNALLLLSIWVGIIFAAYLMVYWDAGSEPPLSMQVLEPPDAVHVDAEGRFSLIYPPTWTLIAEDGTVTLGDPYRTVEVEISEAEEAVPEAALLAALGLVGSDEQGSFDVEETDAGGAERAVRIAAPAEEGDAEYGLAFLYEGKTILMLVRGSADAIAARTSALRRIESGISVPAAPAVEVPVEEAAPVVEL